MRGTARWRGNGSSNTSVTSRSSCSSAFPVRTIRGTRRRPRSTATPTSRSRCRRPRAGPKSTAPGDTVDCSRRFSTSPTPDDGRRCDSRYAPRVLRRRQRHRRCGGSHRCRARRPRDARRHVDPLHERSRRDGRQPRDDVEVRAVPAAVRVPLIVRPPGGSAARSSTRSSSTSMSPRRCATSRRRRRSGRVRAVRCSLSRRRGSGTAARVDQRELGLRVVRDGAAQARRRRGRVVACQLFDLAVDPDEDDNRVADPECRAVVDELMKRSYVRSSRPRPYARTATRSPADPDCGSLRGANHRLPPVSSLAGRCLPRLPSPGKVCRNWRRVARGSAGNLEPCDASLFGRGLRACAGDDEIDYRWRGAISDAELVALTDSYGGDSMTGWWDPPTPESRLGRGACRRRERGGVRQRGVGRERTRS